MRGLWTPLTRTWWVSELVLSLGAAGLAGAARADDVQERLRRADQSRGHLDVGLEYTVDMTCTGSDAQPVHRAYKIRSHGDDAVAATLDPPERKGDLILVNGRFVWELRATSSRPIGVTLAQRLSGLAAVGDIISTGFAEVYTAKADKSAAAKDGERLDLTASNNTATYESGTAWLAKGTGLVTKAEFYAHNKQTLETIEFEYKNTIKAKGHSLPFLSATTVETTLEPRSTCKLAFGSPAAVDTRPEEFDLKKLTEGR